MAYFTADYFDCNACTNDAEYHEVINATICNVPIYMYHLQCLVVLHNFSRISISNRTMVVGSVLLRIQHAI